MEIKLYFWGCLHSISFLHYILCVFCFVLFCLKKKTKQALSKTETVWQQRNIVCTLNSVTSEDMSLEVLGAISHYITLPHTSIHHHPEPPAEWSDTSKKTRNKRHSPPTKQVLSILTPSYEHHIPRFFSLTWGRGAGLCVSQKEDRCIWSPTYSPRLGWKVIDQGWTHTEKRMKHKSSLVARGKQLPAC